MNERHSGNPMNRLRGGDDVLGGQSGGLGANGDAPAEDAVELWARRAGRALAVLATIGLIGWCLYQATATP